MPYQKNQDLPDAVKHHLPKHAQDIYREAFNNAYDEYQDPNKKRNSKESAEKIAFRVAWNAVKKKYAKGTDGNWHQKD